MLRKTSLCLLFGIFDSNVCIKEQPLCLFDSRSDHITSDAKTDHTAALHSYLWIPFLNSHLSEDRVPLLPSVSCYPFLLDSSVSLQLLLTPICIRVLDFISLCAWIPLISHLISHTSFPASHPLLASWAKSWISPHTCSSTFVGRADTTISITSIHLIPFSCLLIEIFHFYLPRWLLPPATIMPFSLHPHELVILVFSYSVV